MGRKVIDRVGSRYGKLLVLSRQGSTPRKEAMWLCQCDCGRTAIVRGSHLSGKQESCGCTTGRKVVDLAGKEFGRLKVIRRNGSMPSGDAAWECLCECGRIHISGGSHLSSGDCKSCGYCRPGGWKHGYSRRGNVHPLYSTWLHMRDRCLNPKFKQYKDYGGRGICIHQPWIDSFETFLEDVKDLYIPGRTIDRIDPDGHYAPGNVRWATRSEQQLNRRKKKT